MGINKIKQMAEKVEKNEIITKKKTKPSKWETTILPRKDEIIKLLENGASEFQVYTGLGMHKDAWINSKKLHPEMQEWIDKARTKIVGELKSALMRKAFGFTYEEKVTEIKQDLDSNGKPVGRKYMYTRTLYHYSPPDTNAIYGCLKIYDCENEKYDTQAKALAMKKDELELKKKILLPEGDADKDLIEKIKDFKIEIIDASKKDGNDND